MGTSHETLNTYLIGFLYNDILSVAVYDRCCTVATYDKITYKTLKNKII